MTTLSTADEEKFHDAVRESISIEIDEILLFIDGWIDPEVVFSKKVLEEWALNNGFVREDFDDIQEEAFTIGERNPSLSGGY